MHAGGGGGCVVPFPGHAGRCGFRQLGYTGKLSQIRDVQKYGPEVLCYGDLTLDQPGNLYSPFPPRGFCPISPDTWILRVGAGVSRGQELPLCPGSSPIDFSPSLAPSTQIHVLSHPAARTALGVILGQIMGAGTLKSQTSGNLENAQERQSP